jgi:hypothetical protein
MWYVFKLLLSAAKLGLDIYIKTTDISEKFRDNIAKCYLTCYNGQFYQVLWPIIYETYSLRPYLIVVQATDSCPE